MKPFQCMYDEMSMRELEPYKQPRRDGKPGTEWKCPTCFGFYSMRDGGRPAECPKGKKQ